MPIQAEDLLLLADLQSTEEGEPWRRSAISRAYYASFHRCLNWEEEVTRQPKASRPKRSPHRQLIERLARPNRVCSSKQKRQCEALVRLMKRQRERRVAADYSLDADVGPDTLREQLLDARNVFKACAW